jgi:hypothetical protein
MPHHRLQTFEESGDTWRPQSVEDLLTALSILEDSGSPQHGQMSRYGRHVRADHFGELANALLLRPGKLIHDEQASGMSKCLDDPCPNFVSGLGFRIH